MQGTITNPAAVDAAVEAWQADKSNATDLMMRLHPSARLLALRRLGYTTRAHLEMFGL